MNRTLAVLVASLLILGLAGCATPRTSQSTTPATSTPGPSSHSGDPSTTQAPSPPGLSASAAAAAIAAAHQVMIRYARPQLSAQAWLSGMDPVLTQDAAAQFAGTDPSQIPAHQVTGAATLASDSTGGGAVATVPTDAGTYQVFLTRANGSTVWLAEQITPPGQ
jgi:hypothetical protein